MPSSGERTGRSLAELAALTGGSVVGDGSVVVDDVTHDSRHAGPGALYVAIRGSTVDGHRFVEAAAELGAAAAAVSVPQPVPIPQLVVPDTRAILGVVAAEVHDHPSERMPVVGVTGTNGKTSVTHMLGGVVAAAGGIPGVVGTLGAHVGDTRVELARTTPEASDLQRLLATLLREGATMVACEVSSHALELGRVEGTRFRVAAFTNLSQDHLDFHGDMDRYFAAKARLFEARLAERAVVWVDDPWGARLAAQVSIPVTTVGFDAGAAIRPRVLESGFGGSRVEVTLPDHPVVEVGVPVAGLFSVANAALAMACALELGIDAEAMVEGLGRLPQIPGRFELVSGSGPVAVVVDYSHTPAGIEAAIATARPLTEGRIVAVLGAGGDRDRAKRPLMGRAASAADIVVVTSDNPRSEPPGAIIDEIVRGVTIGYEAIEDRREAIARAISLAAPGDAVLIMGKGHEAHQEVGGERIPFDDREVARQVLASRSGSR